MGSVRAPIWPSINCGDQRQSGATPTECSVAALRAGAMRHELLIVVLSALRSQAAPCDCTSEEPGQQVCYAKGDPHFKTLSAEKYDFMARGVYPLVRAETACGCTLSIDVLLAAHPRHVGASSVVAAAVHFGDTTVVLQGEAEDSSLTITGSDNDAVLADPASTSSHTFSGVVATGISKKKLLGWQVGLPGGGYLKAFKHNVGMVGAIFSVFVNLPATTAASTSGLCSQVCAGVPPLPNNQCEDSSVCLPVRLDETAFPAATLSAFEAEFSMPMSTRDCDGDGASGPTAANRPPSPPEPPQPPPAPRPPTITKCNPWQPSKRCMGTLTRETSTRDFDECVEWCNARASSQGCCFINTNNAQCQWYAGSTTIKTSNSPARSAFLMTEPCSVNYPPPSPPAQSPPPPAPFPPPPPPPDRTTCPSPTIGDSGTWFSGVLYVKWGPRGTASIDDCQPWCEQQIGDDCVLRMSVLSGHQVSCGFDATPSSSAGTCAVVAGLNLGVTASDIASYHAIDSANEPAAVGCFVDSYGVVPCEPDPIAACEASGANYTLGRTLCGELDPLWQSDCLFDYCAFGGDESWVNITEVDGSIDDEETGRESPSPPPVSPPATPCPPSDIPVFQDPMCVPAADPVHPDNSMCVVLPCGASLGDPAIQRRLHRHSEGRLASTVAR